MLLGVLEQGGSVQTLATMPEFFWELALGIYLTVKGFRPAAAASRAGQDSHERTGGGGLSTGYDPMTSTKGRLVERGNSRARRCALVGSRGDIEMTFTTMKWRSLAAAPLVSALRLFWPELDGG